MLLTDKKNSTLWDVQDGLIGMLDVLLEQKDRFDYVLVEAFGVLEATALGRGSPNRGTLKRSGFSFGLP